jgi:hypothetical protein
MGGEPEVACPSDVPTYAVEFVDVTGRLTKNGVDWAPLPTLQFVLRDGVDDDNRLGQAALSAGGSVYQASLAPGTYDVRVFMPGPIMLNDIVPGGFEVSGGPTELDIDFQTVVVSGAVSFAGGAFPAQENDRGRVCLLEVAGDQNRYCQTISGGSAATFAIEVPRAGVYRPSWSRGGQLAADAPLNDLPYGEQLFPARSFAADTTLDLDVNAPSLVLRGSVASEGIPLSELTPRPDGFVELGPVVIDFSEQQGQATFQIRLLAGTYSSTVYVFSPAGAIRPLLPCPASGCVFSGDTDWPLDVVTPPTAVVQGTLDFVDLAGEAVAESEFGGGGEILLTRVPDGPTSVFSGTGKFVSHVDAARQFRLEGVPFGNYSVAFRRGEFAPGPFGIVRFDGMLLVDREHVTWQRAATVVPVNIEVTVNGDTMPDDTLLEGEPRGELLLTEERHDEPLGYDDGVRLPLGETGPARFERWMLKGQYRVGVSAQTGLGRTYRRGLEEDVLPIGRLELGTISVGSTASASVPEQWSFDLAVRNVSLRVQNTELLASTPNKMSTVISLTSRDGGHPFWTHLPPSDTEVSLRVYAGCYKVAALLSSAPHYPDFDAHEAEVPVGTLCTCNDGS